MSFPASQAFRRDGRVTPTLMIVYQFLFEHLDLVEPRICKLGWLEAALFASTKKKLGKAHIGRALTWLERNGYLIEHRPHPNTPRWFTLAHSVHVDKRPAA